MTISHCVPTAADLTSTVEATTTTTTTTTTGGVSPKRRTVKHKRRYCKTPGCPKIVKSQGLCQRHGAVAKKCRVAGCAKQAQGNFHRMCKSHYNASLNGGNVQQQPPPSSSPSSFGGMLRGVATALQPQQQFAAAPVGAGSVYETVLPASVGFCPRSGTDDVMPLARYLRDGHHQFAAAAAWHRNEERRARGLPPVDNDDNNDNDETMPPLEDWERELAWTELLILSGSSQETLELLSHAWGQQNEGLGHALRSQFLGSDSSSGQPPVQQQHHQPQQPQEQAAAAPCVAPTIATAALSAPPSIVNFNNNTKHLRVSTMDLAFAWSYDDEKLASGILEANADGEFEFENLEEEMEVLSSTSSSTSSDDDDESTTATRGETEEPCTHSGTVVCPPRNGYAARKA